MGLQPPVYIETDAALVDLNHAPLTLLTDWLGER
jgi:hypothetical protein